MRWLPLSQPLLLQVVALALALSLLPLGAPAGRIDPRSGHINPPPGVPAYDPATWNGAWLLTLRNVPRTSELFPAAKGLDIAITDSCAAGDVSVLPGKGAKMGTCTYSLSDDGSSYDLSVKLPGLAKRNGNCYCYALEWFRGGYCLPGTSAGGAPRRRYRQKMTCHALNDAVVSDGAVRVSRQTALSAQPSAGHFIVMMARPDGSCVPGHCGNSDFHVMRKDQDGSWSWKLPGVPASNLDLAGSRVYDPEGPPLPGHYTVCGYFAVQPERMTVGVSTDETGPLDDMTVLEPFRAAGASITTTPLPYNPDSDAQLDEKNVQIFAEDLAWEQKRGTAEYRAWNARQLAALEMDGGGSSNDSNGSGGNSGSNSNSNGGGSSTRQRDSVGASGRRLARRLVAAAAVA